MLSILSVQNLQTFLRRKNLRPPSRPPEGRPPPPPCRGPPCGRAGRSGAEVAVVVFSDAAGVGLLFSSAITLLLLRPFGPRDGTMPVDSVQLQRLNAGLGLGGRCVGCGSCIRGGLGVSATALLAR